MNHSQLICQPSLHRNSSAIEATHSAKMLVVSNYQMVAAATCSFSDSPHSVAQCEVKIPHASVENFQIKLHLIRISREGSSFNERNCNCSAARRNEKLEVCQQGLSKMKFLFSIARQQWRTFLRLIFLGMKSRINTSDYFLLSQLCTKAKAKCQNITIFHPTRSSSLQKTSAPVRASSITVNRGLNWYEAWFGNSCADSVILHYSRQFMTHFKVFQKFLQLKVVRRLIAS